MLLLLLIASTDYVIAQKSASNPRRQGRNERDSMFLQPHEMYFEKMFKRSTPPSHPSLPGLGSSQVVQLYPNVNISLDASPQNEPSVKISRKDPNRVVAAWRDFRTGVEPAVRRVGYSYSTDGGTTWSTSQLLAPFNATYPRTSDPAVGVDTSGNFYIATISITNTNSNGKIIVYKSTDQGETFGQTFVAPADTGNFFDDKEYIESDLTPSSPFANRLYISWTRFQPSSAISMTSSSNGGITWSLQTRIDDGVGGQGSDLCVGPSGDVYIVWAGGPGILFDKSTDGGSSFSTDVLVDSLHGGMGGFPSIACDLSGGPNSGHLYTVFSDGRNGDLDVFLSSSSDGGANWSAPVRVNNDPVGNSKSQYWPWVAVDDFGAISIVFYDTRNTPSNSIIEAYFSRSVDGGQTFTNELLSTAQSPTNTPNGAVRFGDYIGIDAWAGRAVPVWTDERAGGFDMEIYTAVMNLFSSATFSVRSRWNLISLPLDVPQPFKSVLFPTATSSANAFEGTYTEKETLANGLGYWLKFDSAQLITVKGDSVNDDTIDVAEGWNLIGSISKPIPVSMISSTPTDLISSFYYGYRGSYAIEDTIEPGKGYWVKSDSAEIGRASCRERVYVLV